MRIDNATKWKTADLRFMIGQAFRERGVPSKGVEVTVRAGRKRAAGGIAGRGRFVPEMVRTVGASFVRGPVTLKYGRSMWLTMKNPPADFVPGSEEHVEFVVEVARTIDFLVAIMAAKTPAADWWQRPIAWLSDWFEVNRGAKGRLAGCPLTPLEPEPEKDDRAQRSEKKLVHARAMYAKAKTRAKRAATLEKKWARSVAALERQARK